MCTGSPPVCRGSLESLGSHGRDGVTATMVRSGAPTLSPPGLGPPPSPPRLSCGSDWGKPWVLQERLSWGLPLHLAGGLLLQGSWQVVSRADSRSTGPAACAGALGSQGRASPHSSDRPIAWPHPVAPMGQLAPAFSGAALSQGSCCLPLIKVRKKKGGERKRGRGEEESPRPSQPHPAGF